jgi:hypothetical protein
MTVLKNVACNRCDENDKYRISNSLTKEQQDRAMWTQSRTEHGPTDNTTLSELLLTVVNHI